MNRGAISPEPPSLPGLAWRPVTRNDLAALVALAMACQSADGGLAFLNKPDSLLERFFPDAPGGMIGAFDADERLLACASMHLTRTTDTERALIAGLVRPELRLRGLGAYLMLWSQTQAQALFTAGSANKRLLRITSEGLTQPARRLYQAHGFESIFEELVMRRDLRHPLPDSPLPPDATITTWQIDVADQFFQAYETAFRERPGFPGYTATQWISDYNENEHLRQAWSLLARAGDLPAGFVMASAEQPGGYVVQVGVVPARRRRGLASALIVETLRRMRADGQGSADLAVNLNNPGAIQTYIGLGFETIGRRAKYERVVER